MFPAGKLLEVAKEFVIEFRPMTLPEVGILLNALCLRGPRMHAEMPLSRVGT
jgi:hypothetical protein